MSDSSSVDESAVLAALEALEEGPVAAERPARAERSETGEARRPYLELWGLLPLSLDPVVPAAGAEERLLEAIRRGRAAPSPTVEPAAPSAPRPLRNPGGPVGAPARSRGSSRGWLLPLAAAIAVLAVGMSAWLSARVVEQSSEIARLEVALSTSEQRADELEAVRGTLEGQLALVATPGMEVCRLNPMASVVETARGVVFMDPHGGQWLLRVRDLEPAPEGRMYTLWFMRTDGEAMRGGNLEPMAEDSYQLAAEGMPEGMSGIAVTLESDETAERPSGPMVLFGDERFSI